VLIAGFIVTGSQPKKVLIRGLGPSIPVSGALADPTLDLDGVVFNDDWRSSQEGEINATGIPPVSNLESAIVATLQPGPHTAVLRGKNDGTGVGLVEVYDLEPGAAPQLANISTRGQVQTGDDGDDRRLHHFRRLPGEGVAARNWIIAAGRRRLAGSHAGIS